MNLDQHGRCIDSLKCNDPLEIALKNPDILFRRYKEIKELEKIKDLSGKNRSISITSKDVETKIDLSRNEAIEYVLNNLKEYEGRIKFWMVVDDIICFYPKLISNIKSFLRREK